MLQFAQRTTAVAHQFDLFSDIKSSARTTVKKRSADSWGNGKRASAKLVVGRISVPIFVDEFWTPKQRQASSLHEVSYRACFKPQLPAYFVTRLTNESDVVYDPFAGRGTTAVEAALHGRKVISNDVNPLSKILTEPRLELPDLRSIYDRLNKIPFASGSKRSEERRVGKECRL